jgi:uncharacterized membrane protein
MSKNKMLLVFTVSLIGGLVLAACGTGSASGSAGDAQPTLATDPTVASADAPAAAVSFAKDVMPIIQSRCINCHGGERIEAGLSLRTYEDIMAGSENGPVIVPGNAAKSFLVELVASQKMPKRGPKLTPPQVQLITDWVNSGALNN